MPKLKNRKKDKKKDNHFLLIALKQIFKINNTGKNNIYKIIKIMSFILSTLTPVNLHPFPDNLY